MCLWGTATYVARFIFVLARGSWSVAGFIRENCCLFRNKEGFDSAFRRVLGSPKHEWLEIPWFLRLFSFESARKERTFWHCSRHGFHLHVVMFQINGCWAIQNLELCAALFGHKIWFLHLNKKGLGFSRHTYLSLNFQLASPKVAGEYLTHLKVLSTYQA